MNKHTSSLELSHFPVMLNEVINICSPSKGGNFIDCTFGGGGYSKELLKFSKTIDFKIFKSLALMNKNISTINNSNLFLKNLFSELGIFLIEKKNEN